MRLPVVRRILPERFGKAQHGSQRYHLSRRLVVRGCFLNRRRGRLSPGASRRKTD
jgi:hypothetical protein